MPISIDHTTAANDQLMHSGWLTYAGALVISFWGGLTHYFNEKEAFSWRTLIAQLLSSSFAGMLAFFGCRYFGLAGPLTGCVIGICSHMGTPALIAMAMRLKLVRRALEDA